MSPVMSCSLMKQPCRCFGLMTAGGYARGSVASNEEVYLRGWQGVRFRPSEFLMIFRCALFPLKWNGRKWPANLF